MPTLRLLLLSVVLPVGPVLFGACSGSSSSGEAPPVGGAASMTPPDAEPAPTAAACPDGVPFTTLAGKVIVPVSVNGGPAKSWMLDTGAPSSYIDTSVAGQSADVVKLSLGGFARTVTLTAEEPQSRLPGVYGIVGQDLFGSALTIDYPRKRVWITDAINDAALLACQHLKRAPTTVDVEIGDYVYAKGAIEGAPGWFLIDSGASYGATNKGVFATLDKAHPRPSIGGWYTPAAVGTFWARAATIGYMELGGVRVSHIFTRTVDDKILPPPTGLGAATFLGVLPSGFLHHFMLTIDFPAKKLRIDAGKDDSLVEPTTFYVAGLGLEETLTGPVHVTDVVPGSAADKAGIVVGDELVKINGVSAGSIAPAQRAFQLASPTAGKAITVTTARGSSPAEDRVLLTQDDLTSPATLK